MRSAFACAAVALVLLACNPITRRGALPDGGAPADGGSSDGSVTRDGGGASDASMPSDGGGPTDGGETHDAGRDGGLTCGPGYEPSASGCVDIDECARGLHSCLPGDCRNVEGGHRCVTEAVFEFTGAAQTITLSGVTEMTVVALGAQGGCSMGGLGGEATATIPVSEGETFYVYVGGAGSCGTAGYLPGGFNGGGDKYTTSGDFWLGASGGGASDVRRGGTALTNRVIVAAGGGGAGYNDTPAGGAGGGTTGSPGMWTTGAGCSDTRCPGAGGGTSVGGTGGYCNDSCIGLAGALGQGGRGTGCAASGGGGGGGYYGGGGGAHCPGGGGSSRADYPGNTAASTRANVRTGAGRVTIRY